MSVTKPPSAAPGATRDVRHRAREAAVQLLYQWEVGRLGPRVVTEAFWTAPGVVDVRQDAQRTFAEALAAGVVANLDTIDPHIREAAEHWRVERMNVLDRLILRLAVYEFFHEPETPGKVIINEALDLARTFSGEESVRFINGVLDAIRRSHERP